MTGKPLQFKNNHTDKTYGSFNKEHRHTSWPLFLIMHVHCDNHPLHALCTATWQPTLTSNIVNSLIFLRQHLTNGLQVLLGLVHQLSVVDPCHRKFLINHVNRDGGSSEQEHITYANNHCPTSCVILLMITHQLCACVCVRANS